VLVFLTSLMLLMAVLAGVRRIMVEDTVGGRVDRDIEHWRSVRRALRR
jgi:hypothetical protein